MSAVTEQEYGVPVRVLPGLWMVPVPLPIPALRYVLVYVFESSAGVYLVDSGWNDEQSWEALCAGLAELGMTIADVRGVLMTHSHSDHFGLAGRIREESGAWLGLHWADAETIANRKADPQAQVEKADRFLAQCGVPSPWSGQLLEYLARQVSRPTTDPDVLFDDASRPEVPGWALETIWTPGHSPGHVCFYLREHQRLVSGDHVLPRISPNVSLIGEMSERNPLEDYLASLERVRHLEVSEVLPAHQWRFVELERRVTELLEHHQARLAEVERAVAESPATAWSVARALTWSRAWETFDRAAIRSALAEAVSHLVFLTRQRRLRMRSTEDLSAPVLFERAEPQ